MEIFNIIYLGVDEIPPEKQTGMIRLILEKGFQYVYRVEEADIRNPSLRYGDAIPLNVRGPIFRCSCHALLEFDLFCGAYTGSIDIPWDVVTNEVCLRRVLFSSNDGTGRILINVGTFDNATTAKVEVKLSGNCKYAGTNISGVVFASNSRLEMDDCTSVLLLEKPDNSRLKVGDDVIPLSKSFVGVPLNSKLSVEVSLKVNGQDHTGTVSFDATRNGVVKGFIGKDKEPTIHVIVTWCDNLKDLICEIYDRSVYGQRKITLWSVDGISFEVEEKVALEFHLLKDQIRNNNRKIHLSGITSNILSKVINYCKNRVHPSASEINFDVTFVKQFDPVTLFNVIQAAHHFQIKSLMDLTCQALVNNVKRLNFDFANIKGAKYLKRTYSNEDMQDSIKDPGSLDVGSILRQRGLETFINKSHLVDVPISPLATIRLTLFGKSKPIFDLCFNCFMESVNSQPRDPMKLSGATRQLKDLIDGDAVLADYLSYDAVEILLQILDDIGNSGGRKDINVAIQSLAVHILSRALSRASFHKYSKDAVPSLVDLLSNSSVDLNIAGMIALTRLADACPTCIPVILENGALEKVQKIANNIPGYSKLIEWVARFLAVICYRDFPHNKVKEALTISVCLLQIDMLNNRHIVSTCYALQCLTYKRQVAIEGEAWEKLMVRLIAYISYTAAECYEPVNSKHIVIAGSALGVVGNFARWGHLNQIQSLATDIKLLGCFGKMLCCEYKKFSKEACQIISNIAARRQTWIECLREANLIDPLCSLLEEDMHESDVKMEAAWAIFNGIYGGRSQQIDVYP